MRYIIYADRNLIHLLMKTTGHKAVQFDLAPFCTDAFHGGWCISMDSAVVGNWQEACFPALHHNHAPSYALGRHSGELLPALGSPLFARVSRGGEH